LRTILEDPEASGNDRFVALELLKNACVSAGKIMPSCQDTGTATIMATRGGSVLTDGTDEEYISKGVYRAYTEGYLRYSQVAPMDMFKEVNTRTNLPAQIDMMSKPGHAYEFRMLRRVVEVQTKPSYSKKQKAH
jgi:fumarate hydratase class I